MQFLSVGVKRGRPISDGTNDTGEDGKRLYLGPQRFALLRGGLRVLERFPCLTVAALLDFGPRIGAEESLSVIGAMGDLLRRQVSHKASMSMSSRNSSSLANCGVGGSQTKSSAKVRTTASTRGRLGR